MFPNPRAKDRRIYKASRKTDMYAFAILAWEFLSQKQLFPGISSETQLHSSVHAGLRPDLLLLPADTPEEVRDLIRRCWDAMNASAEKWRWKLSSNRPCATATT
jgi:hypothetical protein